MRQTTTAEVRPRSRQSNEFGRCETERLTPFWLPTGWLRSISLRSAVDQAKNHTNGSRYPENVGLQWCARPL